MSDALAGTLEQQKRLIERLVRERDEARAAIASISRPDEVCEECIEETVKYVCDKCGRARDIDDEEWADLLLPPPSPCDECDRPQRPDAVGEAREAFYRIARERVRLQVQIATCPTGYVDRVRKAHALTWPKLRLAYDALLAAEGEGMKEKNDGDE